MEELIGRGVDRTIRFIHSRRLKRWGHEAAPLYSKENIKRFTLVAAAVADQAVRVVELRGDTPPRPYLPILLKMAHPALLTDNGFAWSDGESVFLPVSITEMDTHGAQEALARILIFFLSAQIRYGSLSVAAANRALLAGDRLTADLFWIIDNRRLLHLLRDEYQGLFRVWEDISARLISMRPAARQIRSAERQVEQFLKEALTASAMETPVSASAAESLSMAMALKERWIEEGVAVKRYRAMVPFTPWGKLIPERIKDGLSTGVAADDTKEAQRAEDEDEGADKKEDTKKERDRYMTRSEEVDEEANEQGLLLNIYEKIMSWADFVNVERPFDDDPDEDSSSKADALEELVTTPIERSAKARFDAALEKVDDYNEDGQEPLDDTPESFLYPEWDYRRQRYRQDYSRVTEAPEQTDSGEFVERVLAERRGLIKEIRRKFEMLTPDRSKVSRQTDGDNIDIDAAVEAVADMEAGLQPSDKLYVSYKRTERDLAVLFLIDLSMSTDSWINDRRIIDHELEALVVLSEALGRTRDRYAIHGFSGKGRKGCRFFNIKGFGEEYGPEVKARIGGLVPQQYTRMGPAIRHATEILKAQPSKIKLLFLISDGKPNDIDIYEGRYGVEDSRRAIKEAEGCSIVPFCLTVDNTAHEYLAHIFGDGKHAVLPGVERLARKLPELYARIVQSL
jgi:nitric oxide reductase NorD protein